MTRRRPCRVTWRPGSLDRPCDWPKRSARAKLRDHLLGQIAAAQAGVGAREASLSTLLDVASDQSRGVLARELNERPLGAGGGAAMADFDTLIDLIVSTIAPDTWDEVGGAGAIESFPTGVYVDATGVMKRLAPGRHGELLRAARDAAVADSGNRDVRRSSSLRKVSLVRLERHLSCLRFWPMSHRGAADVGWPVPCPILVRLSRHGRRRGGGSGG